MLPDSRMFFVTAVPLSLSTVSIEFHFASSLVPVTLSGMEKVCEGCRVTTSPALLVINQPPNSLSALSYLSGFTVTVAPLLWVSTWKVSAPSYPRS